mmetsp:Transcript_37676/g.95228  ORF Transcript_37676/g.95228 Transcript_37676/m.95228 type:complete len:193 (-) Transcript_37676:24-602(-)|eukprot:CAMPEP_0202868132 /NCGR_PEP_ID=MMETSP1391-20130828/10268_1 /ASSEMBLY_ACC=CAM_ASM_000867 /TAXON_ID=1034604 /ORGANISM="Chlamydomonas leiostraca, Strain SAG 11-49" /LENGTH=192 /DNA_ID=CAMNT_0049548253 /DNA_START=74 /DNA_END=652 /DNA_ORIENTATION=-
MYPSGPGNPNSGQWQSLSVQHTNSMQSGSFQGAPTSPSSSGVSTLRLKLVEDYRVDPPIPMSAALATLSAPSQASTHAANGPQSLSFEQELVDNAGQQGNHVEEFFKTADMSDMQDEGIRQFTDMGFSRAQASLGIAFCSALKLNQSEVPDFASNYGQLGGMGYDMPVVVGALVRAKNDAGQATEMCLALPS